MVHIKEFLLLIEWVAHVVAAAGFLAVWVILFHMSDVI